MKNRNHIFLRMDEVGVEGDRIPYVLVVVEGHEVQIMVSFQEDQVLVQKVA